MAEGKGRLAWDVGSEIIAKIHNAHCSKRSETIRPDSIHPYKHRVKINFPIGALKNMFGKDLKRTSISAKNVKMAAPAEGSG